MQRDAAWASGFILGATAHDDLSGSTTSAALADALKVSILKEVERFTQLNNQSRKQYLSEVASRLLGQLDIEQIPEGMVRVFAERFISGSRSPASGRPFMKSFRPERGLRRMVRRLAAGARFVPEIGGEADHG